MKNFSILLPAFILFIMQISAVSAQDSETESESQESNVNLDFGTQIVSRNIWRGSDYGAAPAFVPEIALEAKGIQIGAFGALSTLGTYSEIDLFAAYNYKGFTMMFVDYFFPVENIAKNHYFEYRNKYTSHVFEIAFQYERTNRFPIHLFVGTLFYGDDKDPDDGDNVYSTYIEVGYAAHIGICDADFFVGYTPTAEPNFYADGRGFINAGITASKSIKITNSFDLPVFSSLIINPKAEKIFFVFGLTL